jgi:hypothetical protein
MPYSAAVYSYILVSFIFICYFDIRCPRVHYYYVHNAGTSFIALVQDVPKNDTDQK